MIYEINSEFLLIIGRSFPKTFIKSDQIHQISRSRESRKITYKESERLRTKSYFVPRESGLLKRSFYFGVSRNDELYAKNNL